MKIDDELQELKRKHPNHCKTLTVTDSNGVVRELIFPKALDLDRPKRPRTNFTSDQLQMLEDEFERNQYLVGKDRHELSKRLKLSETQVKIWFQNRRTKFKKDQGKPDQDDDNEDALTDDARKPSPPAIRVQANGSESRTKSTKAGTKRKRTAESISKKYKNTSSVDDDLDDILSLSNESLGHSPSPSPSLPLPATLPPALTADSSYTKNKLLTPKLLAAVAGLQQHQSTGLASPSYSPPSTSSSSASNTAAQAAADMAAALLQQKVAASLGAALGTSTSRQLLLGQASDSLSQFFQAPARRQNMPSPTPFSVSSLLANNSFKFPYVDNNQASGGNNGDNNKNSVISNLAAISAFAESLSSVSPSSSTGTNNVANGSSNGNEKQAGDNQQAIKQQQLLAPFLSAANNSTSASTSRLQTAAQQSYWHLLHP